MTIMRLVIALLAAVTLTAPADAQDNDPVALITAVYKTYLDTDPTATPPAPGLLGVYSKRLQALVDKDARETPEGEIGRLDFDVIVDGQDWQLSELKIVPVSQSEKAAEVRAIFRNFGEPRDTLYRLVLEDGNWRIDDIEGTLKPRWVLSKILTDDPEAFPDAESVDPSDAQ
ncbi:MAG: DUF3828 domain-containing protein [Alphaproteobacteria bacterium]|nr:DUF3828 domain-containing protein [Alphaproteobacteria bacterium]